MSTLNHDQLTYYAQHGPITDPGSHAGMLEALPDRIPALVQVVQGALVNLYHAQRMDAILSDGGHYEADLRYVSAMLERLAKLAPQPLKDARPVAQRLVADARDHSVLLAALLREQGIPARARCGFATYLTPERYDDHWLCEVWDGDRWVRVDAQLDPAQRAALGVEFDACDVPPDAFLTAAQAWKLIRRREANPDLFGMFQLQGLWFVRGNLVRDLAALNRIEMLPWDAWGLIDGDDRAMTGAQYALLDDAAALIVAGDGAFREIRAIYECEGLRVPPVITSYTPFGAQRVEMRL